MRYNFVMKIRDLCCVPGCGELLKPLCCLPRHDPQQREWLRVIGNPDSRTKSVGNIYANYRICRKHFTDEAFHKLRYRTKSHGFDVKINAIPSLHLPEIKEDLFPNNININSSESTFTKKTELLVVKEYLKPAYVTIPFSSKQNESFQSNTTNSVEKVALKQCIEQTEKYSGCKKMRIEPVDNVQKNLVEEDQRESRLQTENETYEYLSNIKEECIDFETLLLPGPEKCDGIGNIETPNETKRQDLCCVVPGCGELMKPLCRLPHEEDQQREWLKVIGNPKLNTKYYKTIYCYYRICRKHFTDEAFQNLNYRNHRPYNLHKYLNNVPTLHLPVIRDEGILNMINLNNTEPTSPVQMRPLIQDKAEQSKLPIDVPMTSRYKNNDQIQKDCNATSKLEAGPRTYCREVKIVPEVNVSYLKIEERVTFESYTEIETSDSHQPETFVSLSEIKKERIDLEADTKLYSIDEERKSVIFGEHVSLKLKSYSENTRTVVKNLIDTILLNAENGMYDTSVAFDSN